MQVLGVQFMTKTKNMKWMGKNARPEFAGWHYTKNLNGSIQARYYDDSDNSWWISTAKKGWQPNYYFTEWLNIPGVSDAQHS